MEIWTCELNLGTWEIWGMENSNHMWEKEDGDSVEMMELENDKVMENDMVMENDKVMEMVYCVLIW